MSTKSVIVCATSLALLGLGSATIAVSAIAGESGHSPAAVDNDPLIADIDATIASIDSALNDYIREYLESVELHASEFRSIEQKLERRVKRERKDNPAAYKQVPPNIHLLQAKVQFLQSAHPEFQDGRFPQAVTDKFTKLAELEQRLRDEED